jgi:O-antigen ligase
MILNETHHRWLFLIGLCLVAIGLPLSKAFISIGGITLAVNFLLEGNLKAKFRTLISSPIILLLISVFLMHLVALIWTSDFGHALKDIRIKLPLLLFPIIIPLSKPLSKKELHLVHLPFY